jgi:hypothetical protein
MNATACCPPPPVAAVLPWWQQMGLDLREDLRQAFCAWQAARHERLAWRAMQGLSDHTLRDIGMAERLPPQSVTLSLLDYERSRWS